MKITYRERHYITKYTCMDFERTIFADDYWIPDGTSLIYFKVNRFEVKTLAKEDIIRIEKDGKPYDLANIDKISA